MKKIGQALVVFTTLIFAYSLFLNNPLGAQPKGQCYVDEVGEPIKCGENGKWLNGCTKIEAPTESFTVTAPEGEVISNVFIKAGINCFTDSNNGCYAIEGLGTPTVTVTKVGEDSPECQDISHVEFIDAAAEEPTPTPTIVEVSPTPTEVPVEPTPTVTEVSPTPTSVPTQTEEEPTPTPTPTEGSDDDDSGIGGGTIATTEIKQGEVVNSSLPTTGKFQDIVSVMTQLIGIFFMKLGIVRNGKKRK